METIIKITQFLLSLSLIIIIHEFGHFIFAKLFKCRVEKFYLFFDWKFSLFKKKIGDTTYGIGWIPLGGYVKISGMVDESMDREQLAQEPKPWEYRSKPAWQRLIIIVAGVTMNFLSAAIIYIALAMAYGESYVATKDVHSGYAFSQSAQDIGFQNGDKIVSIGGETIENSNILAQEILLNSGGTVIIERGGEVMEISITDAQIGKLLKEGGFITPRFPFIIASIATLDNSEIFETGDSIVSLGGINMAFADEVTDALNASKGDSVTVGLYRGGELLERRAIVNADGKLGVGLAMFNIYPVTERQFTIGEAIPFGINRGVEQVSSYFDQLGLIFNSETEAYKGVGGFITMGSIFPDTWNWFFFWNITALLSIMIGVLNIMPIPALDGGHLVFIIYEMIARRPPSQKFMEAAQMVGFVLIIGLVLLANGNDIVKLFQ